MESDGISCLSCKRDAEYPAGAVAYHEPVFKHDSGRLNISVQVAAVVDFTGLCVHQVDITGAAVARVVDKVFASGCIVEANG